MSDKEEIAKAFGSVIYECERCGTRQTLEEARTAPGNKVH